MRCYPGLWWFLPVTFDREVELWMRTYATVFSLYKKCQQRQIPCLIHGLFFGFCIKKTAGVTKGFGRTNDMEQMCHRSLGRRQVNETRFWWWCYEVNWCLYQENSWCYEAREDVAEALKSMQPSLSPESAAFFQNIHENFHQARSAKTSFKAAPADLDALDRGSKQRFNDG